MSMTGVAHGHQRGVAVGRQERWPDAVVSASTMRAACPLLYMVWQSLLL
jgi:hypothetical protein